MRRVADLSTTTSGRAARATSASPRPCGGLDSGVVTVLAHRQAAASTRTRTAAFPAQDQKLEAMPDDAIYAPVTGVRH